MPRINSRTGARRRSMHRRCKQGARLDFGAPVAVPEEEPVRGVRLKTVSAFTMLFALLCLFAFMAGRVDVAATNQTVRVTKARPRAPKIASGRKHSIPDGAKGAGARDTAHLATF
jgi:hypothetical protein